MKKSNPTAKVNISASPRALAHTTLMGIGRGRYGNLAVDAVLRKAVLSDPDRHLFTALVYGVIERQVTLDYLISRLSDRPPEALDEPLLWALRMGLYQLIYMDRIPNHAAVGETVSLLPRRVAGYANAVLRSYLRFEESLGKDAPGEKALRTPEAWISRFPDLGTQKGIYTPETVCFGVPLPLWSALSGGLGYERAVSALDAFSRKPPLTLRCNTLHTSPEDLRARLARAGAEPEDGLYLSDAIRLSEGAVTALPGFAEGDFFVQDEASQLCIKVLDAHPDDTVIDTCACPGSKSFGMALTMENRGRIYAFDLHASKLSLIETSAERLGISIIQAAQRDARDPHPELLGKADRVLCDVPCSGLGVIAKKPEIRHKDLTESSRLPAIQADILEASARYLKPDGVLVYSTCTLLPEENQQVVTTFLAKHPEFEPYDFSIPARDTSVCPIVSERGMITLLPDRNGTDGFFIARIKRKRRS